MRLLLYLEKCFCVKFFFIILIRKKPPKVVVFWWQCVANMLYLSERILKTPKYLPCIWLEQNGVLYYALLQPGETFSGNSTNNNSSNIVIAAKGQEFATRHKEINFHQGNAWPNNARPVKK